MRTTALLVVTALLLAGCDGYQRASRGTTSPSPAPTPSAEPVAAPSTSSAPLDETCHAAELSVALGEQSGGTGGLATAVVFTNTGNRTCTMVGFPGVSFVTGENGQQIGPAAARDGEVGAPVRLGPGETAAAPLLITSFAPHPAQECRVVDTGGLRIYPPGDTVALFLPDANRTCGADVGEPLLHVGTVVAG
ncbi:DUF4232 domain-containing protein [Umezawaea beigongshangensis]|uniref:DUF4232 domain-containing protein n=1 Tax=Umezawaea beigongshangensis TaxID=2780383 RepID=UPI0018F13852|nr:DUF4232 domain-containing protein [Umezawaea beigongshangensis]